MATWSDPVDIMGNVLSKIATDPQASQIMKGVGLAFDASTNAEPAMLSRIPQKASDLEPRQPQAPAVNADQLMQMLKGA